MENTNTDMSRDMVLESLRGAIMAQFPSVTPSQLVDADSTRVVQDLSFDSLDVIELLLNLESFFGIEIPDTQFENFESEITVGQVADIVTELLSTSHQHKSGGVSQGE